MIEPIKLLSEGEKIKPVKFLNKGEKIKPLSWCALHEQDDGKIKGVLTEDSRLALHRIPKEVENPKRYLKDLSNYLDGNINMPQIVQVEKDMLNAEERIANFDIIPILRKIYYDKDGKEIWEKETLECEVKFDRGYPQKFTIPVKDISSLCKMVKKRFSITCINYDIKNVEKYIENEFRKKTEICKVHRIYSEAGWVKMSKGYIYLHDAIRLGENYSVETGLTLQCMRLNSNSEILQIVKNAWNLYEDKVSLSTMLMFSYLGVLWRPFNEAGFPPHFTLFLNGKTGSMKTTIGKILYMQLCEPDFKDSPRRIDSDTAVSLERAVVSKGRDTVTLIDDFSPAKTENKKRDMTDKLEMLIRMVGDGSSKSRSNTSLDDCRGGGVQGVVVLTGELMGKGLSSNLRCLYCKMQREAVNLESVTWFQNNPAAYGTLIDEFAKYVGAYFDYIVNYIKEKFGKGREKCAQIIKEKRLIDSAATLIITAYIVRDFLQKWCHISENEIRLIYEGIEEKILQSVLISQSMSVEESPAKIFLKTVDDLERIGVIRIKSGKMQISDLSEFDGFIWDEYIYLNPELTLKKVIQFLRQSNVFFPFDVKEVEVMLAEDGISKTCANGSGKRTLCARVKIGDSRKYNFVKIPVETFKKVIANEEYI